MKKLVLLSVSILVMISCGKKENPASDFSKPTSTESTASESSYNPELGEGKFDKIDLPETLDHEMAALGEIASGTKCLSCHKLTSERLVGPGWAGVTERRTPEWIMNFITNPDPMIDKDPELQAQDRKSTRLNSSHVRISYAVFCLKKKKKNTSFHNQ